ncbi:hypothetical protein AB0I35_08555 [Nocardia sp. NPDC050378]|uniref:hypothetical protein n=1 Tax=Nocardia sp. NPDC050378 TaxID=3155400 RepID=UPI0033F7BADB
MTGALDPLDANTGRLQSGLTRPAAANSDGGIASVQVNADGSIAAIHLTDTARRLDPDSLVAAITRLHGEALAESRRSINAAIAALDNDPRLRAQRERYVDALDQPLPPQPLLSPSQTHAPSPRPQAQHFAPDQAGWPTAAAPTAASSRRGPTQEDDDADDEYFRRQSWLE